MYTHHYVPLSLTLCISHSTRCHMSSPTKQVLWLRIRWYLTSAPSLVFPILSLAGERHTLIHMPTHSIPLQAYSFLCTLLDLILFYSLSTFVNFSHISSNSLTRFPTHHHSTSLLPSHLSSLIKWRSTSIFAIFSLILHSTIKCCLRNKTMVQTHTFINIYLHIAYIHAYTLTCTDISVHPFTHLHTEEMPKYAAPTPDEIALVRGSYINGVKLLTRTSGEIGLEYTYIHSLFFLITLFTLRYSCSYIRTHFDAHTRLSLNAHSLSALLIVLTLHWPSHTFSHSHSFAILFLTFTYAQNSW